MITLEQPIAIQAEEAIKEILYQELLIAQKELEHLTMLDMLSPCMTISQAFTNQYNTVKHLKISIRNLEV